MLNDVMLGVLSWRSPKTIAASLADHAEKGLPDHFARAVVFFQEISPADRAVAARHGFEALGDSENLGIYGGVKALAKALEAEYLVLLENDHLLIEPADTVRRILDNARAELADGATVVRLRSRSSPGDGGAGVRKYLRAFAVADPLPNADMPLHASGALERTLRMAVRGSRERVRTGLAVHVERDPVARHPGVISLSRHGNFLCDSSYAPWTNQCYMIKRDFLLDTLLPAAAPSAEASPPAGRTIETNLPKRWWRDGGFTVAFSNPGLFTHRRLDR